MPITVDVISLVPITYKQCISCELFYNETKIGQQVDNEIMHEYPQDILEEQQRLSTMVVELINRFQNKISIRIIDPNSLQGIMESLKYRVRSYPTFIIDGKEKVIGWNQAAVEEAIATCSSSRKTLSVTNKPS